MTNSPSQEQISQMFNEISPVYDLNNRILSMGIDRRWRKALEKHLPKGQGLDLLDLATGTCDQLLSLMKTQKFKTALGIDPAAKMLKVGQQKVNRMPFASRVILEKASALEIPAEDDSFSCITISFGIRNVGDYPKCLKEMHRVLAPKGKVLILEFSLPDNKLIRSAHLFYLRHFIPFIGGLFSGKKQAYRYLNKTIESFPCGEAFCLEMQKAGFTNVAAHPLTFGVATLYAGEKS